MGLCGEEAGSFAIVAWVTLEILHEHFPHDSTCFTGIRETAASEDE
jgi:hypothetical protein